MGARQRSRLGVKQAGGTMPKNRSRLKDSVSGEPLWGET